MSETVNKYDALRRKKTFTLICDELCYVWERTHYTVEAETLEEAIAKAEKGDVLYQDSETLYDTTTLLEPSDNDGQATVEWYVDEEKPEWRLVKTNGK